MKIPRYDSPPTVPEGVVRMPAVSGVIGGCGFLAESAPIAQFGTTKTTAVPYLLLTHTQRCRVSAAIPDFDRLSLSLPPDYERPAVMNSGASVRVSWHNAENMWVAVPWLLAVMGKVDLHTHGSRMVLELARSVVA